MISWKPSLRMVKKALYPPPYSLVDRSFSLPVGFDAMGVPRNLVKLGHATGSRPSPGKIGVPLSVTLPQTRVNQSENSPEFERSDKIALSILQTVSTRADTMLYWEL